MSAQERAELIAATATRTRNGNGNGHTEHAGRAALAGRCGRRRRPCRATARNGNGTARPAVVEELIGTGPRPKPPVLDAQTWNEYQERVTALVQGYRMRGHRFADLDPLGLTQVDQSELSLERFGLADVDPNTMFATGNFAGDTQLPLREIVRRLKETYARTIGAEFRNIEEPEIRGWIQERHGVDGQPHRACRPSSNAHPVAS